MIANVFIGKPTLLHITEHSLLQIILETFWFFSVFCNVKSSLYFSMEYPIFTFVSKVSLQNIQFIKFI